jgi:D-glycero-alpha-D-manno-heptose-7-phosphate kinase
LLKRDIARNRPVQEIGGNSLIIIQTPLRVSLFGGGTDFPSFIREEGGCVLSSAIDKYIFVTIKERFDSKLRIGYTQTEMVDKIDEIHHELIRESLRLTGIDHGVEITTMGDIPSEGTGLGSSSTVTVGALHAMYAYRGEIVPTEQLARDACKIEIEALKKPIGVQDQYIAAYGGFRFFEFLPDGQVKSEKLSLSSDAQRVLNDNLLLFFTGVGRSSASILGEQKSNIQNRTSELREIKQLARQARGEIEQGNIDAIGCLMDQSWELKKRLAQTISNGHLNAIYESARHAGAIGGKITGAGGGGFILLYVPYECQNNVRSALNGLQELPFRLEADGTKVIFNYRRF